MALDPSCIAGPRTNPNPIPNPNPNPYKHKSVSVPQATSTIFAFCWSEIKSCDLLTCGPASVLGKWENVVVTCVWFFLGVVKVVPPFPALSPRNWLRCQDSLAIIPSIISILVFQLTRNMADHIIRHKSASGNSQLNKCGLNPKIPNSSFG